MNCRYIYLGTISITTITQSVFYMFLSAHREFLAVVGSEKARTTNMNCEVITTVKHDKSDPVVDITFCKYYQAAVRWCGRRCVTVGLH